MSLVRNRQFLIASAKSLGLTIPRAVLLRADRVIGRPFFWPRQNVREWLRPPKAAV